MKKALIAIALALAFTKHAYAEPAPYYAAPVATRAHYQTEDIDAVTVKGVFGIATAGFKFDDSAKTITELQFAINATTLMMSDKGLLETILGKTELGADVYEEITFIQNKPATFEKDVATIEGDLKVRDTVKPVSLAAKLKRVGKSATGEDSASFNFTATFKRADFGVGDPMQGKRFADEVTLTLDLQALKN